MSPFPAILFHYPCAAVIVIALMGLTVGKSRKPALALLWRLGIAAAVAALVFLAIQAWHLFQIAEDGSLLEKLALRRSLRSASAWPLFAQVGGALTAQLFWFPAVRKSLPSCLVASLLGDAGCWIGIACLA